MDVIREPEGFRTACDAARAAGRSVGFVPTMGALHEGHASLMRAARERSVAVALSIFVNPLQFGPSEDLAAYPRDLDADLKIAEAEGVELVFAPSAQAMYPDGEPQVTVDPGPVGEILEGAVRPGHFRGVCTVVTKLLSLAGPCSAFLGEKDAQQLFIVRRMVNDLNLPVDVVSCSTVRDRDGLAMSSRNAYLTPPERVAARCLSLALRSAVRLAAGGEREAAGISRAMAEAVEAEPLATLDYVTIVDEATFAELDVLPQPPLHPASLEHGDAGVRMATFQPAARALIAVRIGSTRLIDTMPLPPSMTENP